MRGLRHIVLPGVLAGAATLLHGGVPPEVPLYGVFEVVLVTPNGPPEPYLAMPGDMHSPGHVVGTFQGPGGSPIVLDGFWDGAGTWRVRMAPTALGTWTYQTSSNDPALVTSGSFVCIPSTSRGFVEVDPAHPHHFRSANGQPFHWTSTAIQLAHFDDRDAQGGAFRVDNGTFQAFLDVRRAQGFTTAFWGFYGFNKPQFEDSTQLNEGGPPFVAYDPERLNPAYFQYGDLRVRAALERGIVPGFILGWPDEGLWTSVGATNLVRYWRYVIARYAAYDVYWNLFGEANEFDGDWLGITSDFGEMTRRLDPYDHPLTTHLTQSVSATAAIAAEPWVDFVVLQQLASATSDDLAFGKPVLNSEYEGYEVFQVNGEQLRPLLWRVRMEGGYVTYESWGDSLQSSGATYAKWQNLFFEQRTAYWLLEHHPELFGGRDGLAWPGVEYVVYLPAGQSVVVELSRAPGPFAAWWYDPRTGQLQALPAFDGGRDMAFVPPNGQDWVLHVKHAPDCDGGGSAPGEITDLTLAKGTGAIELEWSDVNPADPSLTYDVVRGPLSLVSSETGAVHAMNDLLTPQYVEADAECAPAAGDGCWYLVHAENSCFTAR